MNRVDAGESKSRYRLRTRRTGAGGSLLAHGEPMVWLTGGGLIICLVMIAGILGLILVQGVGTFWPLPLVQVKTLDGNVYMGEPIAQDTFKPSPDDFKKIPNPALRAQLQEEVAAENGVATRLEYRTGNFELSGDHFKWVEAFNIEEKTQPEWALLLERQAWGRFYGYPAAFKIDGEEAARDPAAVWKLYEEHHDAVRERWHKRRRIEKSDIGHLNDMREDARLMLRQAEIRHGKGSPEWNAAFKKKEALDNEANERSKRFNEEISALEEENERYEMILRTADGKTTPMLLADIVRAFPANQLSLGDKLGIYFSRWGEFLTADPREANSEGGVFPAIFGTVLMTLLMSVLVVPYGVMAALYLREYAKPGPIVSAVRIAINNLAGVPSIVFGVFGLGFFCYGMGSFIDGGPDNPWTAGAWSSALVALVVVGVGAVVLGFFTAARPEAATPRERWASRISVACWIAAAVLLVLVIAKTPYFDGFFQAKLPNPTFGKGALVWASLTLALLTLPVVIVATEEALAAVPNSMREGSYGCGASKWQTIRRIVLPRAMPGIMTGMILAMARGAGEVAPLMIVGAVKLAPELPIAAEPPFGINRSFMHLGFHIFDLGFQSPNSEAAKPMVYTTTLLLITIVAVLNVSAIWLRSRLRRKFVGNQF